MSALTVTTDKKPAISKPSSLATSGGQMMVTMRLDNQRLGIPVHYVRDVLKDQKITPIPRAPREIAGSINLRGRIVTVINMREILGSKTTYGERPLFIVIDYGNEFFSLLVDSVQEVMNLAPEQIEHSPANLGESWRNISSGVCQLEEELLVLIDINKLFATSNDS